MDTSVLSYFDLNRNDIRVYKSLISLGRSKTGPIIKESGITSSRVYESLRILAEKGLVSYQVKNNVRYYKAEEPLQLLEEANENISKLKALGKEIASFPITIPTRNEANIYEGKRGFKMAFTQHIDKMKKGEQISIIAFSKRSFTKTGSKELRAFFKNSDIWMMPKKCDARMLTEKEMLPVIKKDRIDPQLYKLRFLPSGYFGPYAINISAEEILLSVWGESPIVFSIKNPVIVSSFQNNFDFLWSIAKK